MTTRTAMRPAQSAAARRLAPHSQRPRLAWYAIGAAIGAAIGVGAHSFAMFAPHMMPGDTMLAVEGVVHAVLMLIVVALVLRLLDKREQLQATSDLVIEGLGSILEAFDYETKGHCDRVAAYAELLAEQLGLSDDERKVLRRAAFLHDIGKTGIPAEIITKPGPLTDEEWDLLRQHPVLGEQRLIGAADLHPLLPVVRWHHERFDGRGYPDGLAGDQIPLMARMFSIIDTYDAITSNRVYRAARSHDCAIEILEEERGHQFCGDCLDAFLRIPREQLQAIRNSIPAAA